jgi:hypothetical protein
MLGIENVAIIDSPVHDHLIGQLPGRPARKKAATLGSRSDPVVVRNKPIVSRLIVQGYARSAINVAKLNGKSPDLPWRFAMIVDLHFELSGYRNLNGSVSLLNMHTLSKSAGGNVSALDLMAMRYLIFGHFLGGVSRRVHFLSRDSQIFGLSEEGHKLKTANEPNPDRGPEHPPIGRIALTVIGALFCNRCILWFGLIWRFGLSGWFL